MNTTIRIGNLKINTYQKEIVDDEVNLYQEAVISLGNQFTKIDNRLDEMKRKRFY